MDKEEIQLVQQALGEIKNLRKKNQLMSARLNMFDDMMSLLHTEPVSANKGMMHPDLVFELEKMLEPK